MASCAVEPERRYLAELFWPVFVPATLFGVGMGAAAPVVALAARDLGAPVWIAALVASLSGFGMMLGDLPSGVLVARLGERKALVLASFTAVVGVVLCILAPSVEVLGVGVLITGVSNAVWGLARQSYLSAVVPLSHRARVMSTFGLTFRIGMFVGPVAGAGLIALIGIRGGFVIQGIGVLLAGLLMVRQQDADGLTGSDQHQPLAGVIAANSSVLVTLGSGSVLLGAARAAVPVVLPLWAEHIGLSAAVASLAYAAAAAIDMSCGYPAGYLMDRFGRAFVAVPSVATLGAGYVLIAFAHSAPTLIAVALVFGIGNGFGNGIIMTIGADTAPPGARAEYLAAWRLMHDIGWFAGPLIVSGLAVVLPLSAAFSSLAAASAVGAGVFARYLPKFTPSRKEIHVHL
ncbi:MAG: MFS transporter [Nocardiaceae bacterium]|nr:MFS transporter [Nocardiaceae bacterium]